MIDAEKMKASWLEAVVNGEAEGFARHWMPDILDALASRPAIPLTEEEKEALKWADVGHICGGECPQAEKRNPHVKSLAACVRRLSVAPAQGGKLCACGPHWHYHNINCFPSVPQGDAQREVVEAAKKLLENIDANADGCYDEERLKALRDSLAALHPTPSAEKFCDGQHCHPGCAHAAPSPEKPTERKGCKACDDAGTTDDVTACGACAPEPQVKPLDQGRGE